MQTPIRKLQL
jgi:hypothetical protein